MVARRLRVSPMRRPMAGPTSCSSSIPRTALVRPSGRRTYPRTEGCQPGWALQWSPDAAPGLLPHVDRLRLRGRRGWRNGRCWRTRSSRHRRESLSHRNGTRILVHDQGRYRNQGHERRWVGCSMSCSRGEDACCETDGLGHRTGTGSLMLLSTGTARRDRDLRFRGVDGLAGWFETRCESLRLEGLRHHERRVPLPVLGSERDAGRLPRRCGGSVGSRQRLAGTGEVLTHRRARVRRSWRSGGLTGADTSPADVGQGCSIRRYTGADEGTLVRAGRRAHARSMHIGERGGRSASRRPVTKRLGRH